MQYLTDNQKNKVYLCINYPFSNLEHVYYDKTGSEGSFTDENNVFYNAEQANLKRNIYNFVKKYTSERANAINNLSAIDLTKGTVRLPIAYKQGINYNYMIITSADNSTYDRNINYYYCFIDGIEWSSNLESATIHFRIDSWNTYAPRIDFMQSYIEREHVSNDAYGLHTIDEGLSPSNYKVVRSEPIEIGEMTPVLALGTTNRIYYSDSITGLTTPDALYPTDAYGYNPLLIGDGYVGTTHVTIGDAVDYLTKAGVADGIIGAYLLPSDSGIDRRDLYILVDPTIDDPSQATNPSQIERVRQFQSRSTPTITTQTINKQTSIYGHELKNNKTLTYPFYFLNISNQIGNELTLKFENSNVRGTITLQKVIDNNINGAMYINAYNYDGVVNENLDYTVQTLNYPTLPFIVDSYDSYIASNKNVLANSKNYIDNDYKFGMKQGALEADATQTMSQINNLISVGMGTSSGGGAVAGPLGVVRAFTDLYQQSTNAQLKINAYDYQREKASDAINASLSDKAVMPDKYCGRYAPNNLLATNHVGVIVKTMCAMPEELEAIDRYFSRYGYRVNTFAVPNLQNRVLYDFKKVIDINFTCECPNNDINIIKSMFNNGVTLWHTTNKKLIFKFDGDNHIV